MLQLLCSHLFCFNCLHYNHSFFCNLCSFVCFIIGSTNYTGNVHTCICALITAIIKCSHFSTVYIHTKRVQSILVCLACNVHEVLSVTI